jgi:hypothetical protein
VGRRASIFPSLNFEEALIALVAHVRGVLGDEGTFAEREATSLWLLSEVQREYGR